MDSILKPCRQNYFTNKKTVIQFVLALLVFFIHFRVFSTFKNANGYLSAVLDILLSLTHVAVPLFFFISAALFYRDYRVSVTFDKWKRRFFSLCVPYLIWNSVWVGLAIIGYYTPLGKLLGGVRCPASIKAVFEGIFLHRFFEPFWFMLQLIVLTILSPVIYLLLRNKIFGLMSIAAVFALSTSGVWNEGLLIESPKMVCMYMIGAWIGMHHFEWITFKLRKKQAFYCLMVFFVCCILSYMNIIQRIPPFVFKEQFLLIITLMSSVAFYFSFDLLNIQTYPIFMKDSFLIYAMHSFIGAAVSKLMCLTLPKGDAPQLLAAIMSFVLTIIIICVFGKVLERYTPMLYRLLVGRILYGKLRIR